VTSFTGKSIQIDIPPSFGLTAGFHLGKTAIPSPTDERFRLTMLEIRRPAQAYAGLGQELSHVMEMVLIHRELASDQWANVILPFQVSTSGAEMDIINPIIDGTKLPTRISQTGYVMASATGKLSVGSAFDNATFSEFWNTAPAAGCKSTTCNVRFFMRTNVLSIGVDTFAQLSNALESAPAQEPVQPPETTWLIDTCRNSTGVCKIKKPEDIAKKLLDLEKYQTQAMQEQTAKKADLDKNLGELKQHTGVATKESIALYQATVAAYNDLKAAASQLSSVEFNVDNARTLANEAKTAVWDQEAPKTKPALAATSAINSAKPDASFADVSLQKQEQRNDCSALGQSPVDIDTKKVLDPSHSAPALIQPLAFRYMSLADGGHSEARLQLSHRGRHLRVAVPPGSVEWPLGGVLSSGVLRGVSYVDIHVPGEHKVDGHVPVAELQLVHESAAGKPAMAVAVPLELGDNENEWLKPLLGHVPTKGASKEVFGSLMSLLHSTLASGATSSYLRYDGSLTKPPCLATEWFLLEKAGTINQQQLSELGDALGIDVSSPESMKHGPAFMTSLVMRGSPHIVGKATETADIASSSSSTGLRVRRRAQL